MRKALTALLATGFIAGTAGAGLACTYHSAHLEKKLTTAQSEQVATEDESAMSTHDPETLKLEEKVETE
ncbi:MAG: hypothetical protein KDJ90_22280 [Nitratireductor sp.]|nr:hypothetical protein [Nitratireductor sp.]